MKTKLLIFFNITALCLTAAEDPKLDIIFAHGLGGSRQDFYDDAQNLSPRHAPAEIINRATQFNNYKPSLGPAEGNRMAHAFGTKLSNQTSFVAHSQGTAATLHYLASLDDCSQVASLFLNACLADPGKISGYHMIGKLIPHPECLGKKIVKKYIRNFDPAAPSALELVKTIKDKGLTLTCPIIICHGTGDQLLGWEHGYILAREFYNQGFTNVYFIEHSGGHNDLLDPDFDESQTVTRVVQTIYAKHGIGATFTDNYTDLETANQNLFEQQSRKLAYTSYRRAALQTAAKCAASSLIAAALYSIPHYLLSKLASAAESGI
jgi:predicted esterase